MDILAENPKGNVTLSIYNDNHRELQDQFDSRRLADSLEGLIVREEISPADKAFIESREFFFLCTLADDEQPTVSFKGGHVTVIDEKTIAFPSYNGNGMFYSTGNMRSHEKVGLLFIDFEQPNRIRFHGSASVSDGDDLMAAYPEAELIVRITLSKMWVNCPRYIPKMQKLSDSPNLPRPGKETPVADWKRIEGMEALLPEQDQERVAEAGKITAEEYDAIVKGE